MGIDPVELSNLRKVVEHWAFVQETPPEMVLESIGIKPSLGMHQYAVVVEVQALVPRSDPAFGIALKSYQRKLADLALQVFLHKGVVLTPIVEAKEAAS